eukprot:3421894-Rhodomonas_salina.2
MSVPDIAFQYRTSHVGTGQRIGARRGIAGVTSSASILPSAPCGTNRPVSTHIHKKEKKKEKGEREGGREREGGTEGVAAPRFLSLLVFARLCIPPHTHVIPTPRPPFSLHHVPLFSYTTSPSPLMRTSPVSL